MAASAVQIYRSFSQALRHVPRRAGVRSACRAAAPGFQEGWRRDAVVIQTAVIQGDLNRRCGGGLGGFAD
jgi:hypothetical protein